MFLDTPRNLRSVIHSLLLDPFAFEAENSFRQFDNGAFLDSRGDSEPFMQFCIMYDDLRSNLAAKLPVLFLELPNKYDFKIGDLKTTKNVIQYSLEKSSIIQDYKFDVIQYLESNVVSRQLDRLYDLLNVKTSGSECPLSNNLVSEIIKFFVLNELLSLMVAGKLIVKKQGKSFVVSAKDSKQKAIIRRFLFAKSMASESSQADLFYFKMLSESSTELNKRTVDLLGELILNKELFINKSLLDAKSKSLRSTQYIINCVNLIAVLIIVKINNNSLKVNRKVIEELGISYDFVREIIIKQKQSLVTEQFIYEKDGIVELHIESWSSNLPGHLKKIVEEFGEGELVKQYLGGMFFEVNYIKEVLQTNSEYTERFVVKSGFDRNQVKVGVKNKADIDLVVFDKKLNHYYFLQVKYALEGNTPYFNGAVKRLQSDLSKGIEQLSEAKRLHESALLEEVMRSKGFNYTSNSSSSFILIHNLPDYDYQSTDYGVAMYDWNSFRNLILDFRIFVSTDKSSGEVRGDYFAPLHDPDSVIRNFFTHHSVFKGKDKQVFLVESSTMKMQLEENIVEVHGIGLCPVLK